MKKSDNVRTQFMKPTEAAIIGDVSTRTITRMCCDGTITAVKLRGSWRINRDAFMRQFGLA